MPMNLEVEELSYWQGNAPDYSEGPGLLLHTTESERVCLEPRGFTWDTSGCLYTQ